MSPDRWTHVKQLFARAAALPAGERGGFLAQECGGDDELMREVRSLLEAMTLGAGATSGVTPDASAGAGSGVETVEPASGSGPEGFEGSSSAPVAVAGESAGSSIGPYVLLQPLGEGGFGTVWLAEQRRPVVRRVALKLIKAGMDTRQVVARFEAERQALALMDHAGIARVFDGGATESGRPYFVMELVSGEPITAYCDCRKLPIRARLELFAQVCEAVQHAHQKGIIHRDIKPSNVIVAEKDGDKPAAKVIDFGIAKATGARLTDKTVFTEQMQMIGTPAYMSPEQAAGSLDIDTRTDVYSLGVLLYELLTGSTPFETKTLKAAAYHEIQRMICEVEPPVPSARLSGSTETLPGVAAQRDVDPPHKLTRTIRGELDWIVMRCLEKDRGRRYETANGLAADVQRYLSDEPVQAGPPSRVYVARKFFRRNRGAVLMTAVLLSAIAAGAAGSTWQAFRARAAERASESRLAQVLLAAQKQRAVHRFIEDLLRLSTAKADGWWLKQASFDQVLDEAAAQIDYGLARDETEVEADIRSIIARAYLWLDRLPDAERHARRAVAVRQGLPATEQIGAASDLSFLAEILGHQGKHSEAEQCCRQAISLRRATQAVDPRLLLVDLRTLDRILGRSGDNPKREIVQREALAIAIDWVGEEDELVANQLDRLALCLALQGKYREAEPFVRRAIDLFEKLAGSDYFWRMVSLQKLEEILKSTDRRAEADTLRAEVQRIRDHAAAESKTEVGTLYGKMEEAIWSVAGIERASSGRLWYAWRKLKTSPNAPRDRCRRFLVRIVRIFENRKMTEDAARWRRELADFDESSLDARMRSTAPSH